MKSRGARTWLLIGATLPGACAATAGDGATAAALLALAVLGLGSLTGLSERWRRPSPAGGERGATAPTHGEAGDGAGPATSS